MSPRNSAPAVVNMLEKTSSHRIITQSALSVISGIKKELASSEYALEIDELPKLYDIFPTLARGKASSSTFLPYPSAERKFKMDDVVMYLHSSGSTGFPKPIAQTHRTALEWANCRAYYFVMISHQRAESLSNNQQHS